MKVQDLSHWEAFLAVATHGGFSKAAHHLGVPLPQMSKRVARIEEALGVRLFHRTTRHVALTSEAKALLPKITAILQDLRETELSLGESEGLSGTIRITCVPFLAHSLLLPSFDKFLQRHPQLHLDLELSESFQDLIKGEYDMAIRIESPKDSDMVYRKLAPNNLVFCAAPEYLKGRKKISSLEDLRDQDLLYLDIHEKCRFEGTSRKLGEFRSAKKLTCSNGVFLTDMALRGQGLLVRSMLDVHQHLESGRLVQVLKDHALETFGYVHAVVPSRRYLAPRVRAFFDFVVEESNQWVS